MNGACDAHFHVFGPLDKYPARDPKLRYKMPYAPLEEYLAHARAMGFERFVLVQPSAYLRDNSCMLDAMQAMDRQVCRGIVDIDEDAPEALLAEMNALGVRGVRINVSPIHPPESGLADKLIRRVDRLEPRLREIGWHFDFLTPGWLTEALLPRMRRLKVDYTLAHMGMFPAKDGPALPGFRKLLDLLRSGENGCYVKLTGVYRMSQAPGFADAQPMARALMEAAPDRLIWGSDHPHLSFADKVSSEGLFALLEAWAPDPGLRRKILVDNPARLFGL
jgi:2-pyrone-4,6-dicarboxylate lactonase